MNCLKLFGERIMSRDPNRQTAEIQIRIAIMNRTSVLGRAEIEAVALSHTGKGKLAVKRLCATSPSMAFDTMMCASVPLSVRRLSSSQPAWFA